MNISDFSTTDSINCPITEFIFKETTSDNKGLNILDCPIPSTTDECRTIIVPTDKARISGGSLPIFSY